VIRQEEPEPGAGGGGGLGEWRPACGTRRGRRARDVRAGGPGRGRAAVGRAGPRPRRS
jgi:hypothetical protein